MESALPPERTDSETRVVDLRARRSTSRLGEVEARLAEAEAEASDVRIRLAAAVLVRDRLADQLAASQATIREAQAQVRAARQQVTDRLAGEVRALAAVGELQAEVAALTARLAGRDDRDAVLARLAGELADAARLAREDVERHVAARAEAEARLGDSQHLLAAERSRAAEVVAALRAEVETLRAARDDAVVARTEAQAAARRVELQKLQAARDRLREPEGSANTSTGVIVDLARAAARLRLHAAGEEHQPASIAVPSAPAAGPSSWSLLRRVRVRRLLNALRDRAR